MTACKPFDVKLIAKTGAAGHKAGPRRHGPAATERMNG